MSCLFYFSLNTRTVVVIEALKSFVHNMCISFTEKFFWQLESPQFETRQDLRSTSSRLNLINFHPGLDVLYSVTKHILKEKYFRMCAYFVF